MIMVRGKMRAIHNKLVLDKIPEIIEKAEKKI